MPDQVESVAARRQGIFLAAYGALAVGGALAARSGRWELVCTLAGAALLIVVARWAGVSSRRPDLSEMQWWNWVAVVVIGVGSLAMLAYFVASAE